MATDPASETSPAPAAAADGSDDVLLRVENLVKYFPIKGTGLFRREGIRARRRRRELYRAAGTDVRRRRRDRVRQVDAGPVHRPAARRHLRPDRLRRPGHHPALPAAHAAAAPEIQMIFQDPIGSLNPRRRVGSIIGDPFAIHRTGLGRGAQAPGAGTDGAGGAQPGALQPVPGGVLRRPAAADRGGPGARLPAEADHLRRAGVGPRRLHPGAGHQPARRPADRLRAHLHLHRARPFRGAPRQQRPSRSCTWAR